jgi:hypothetical protein
MRGYNSAHFDEDNISKGRKKSDPGYGAFRQALKSKINVMTGNGNNKPGMLIKTPLNFTARRVVNSYPIVNEKKVHDGRGLICRTLHLVVELQEDYDSEQRRGEYAPGNFHGIGTASSFSSPTKKRASSKARKKHKREYAKAADSEEEDNYSTAGEYEHTCDNGDDDDDDDDDDVEMEVATERAVQRHQGKKPNQQYVGDDRKPPARRDLVGQQSPGM